MQLLSRISKSNFFIRLRKWEYWPFGIIHFPFFLYWLWLSARARSLIFFSASNPGIVMGGMLGESKFDVLKIIPAQYVPPTALVKLPTSLNSVKEVMQSNRLIYPLICKPVYGERGWNVSRVNDDGELLHYLDCIRIDFIIQEFVDLPEEYSVFYVRYPETPNGFVRSLVAKEMLSVTGNGHSTLGELMLSKDRARLQWNKLKIKYAGDLEKIPENGERCELVSIGNHSLGTMFINCDHLITNQLSATFDKISKEIAGFYFGRFDLRCHSFNDLATGQVKILELNGCGAEPIQIYDPSFPLARAFRVLARHWRDLYLISTQNHRKGTPYTPLSEAIKLYKAFRTAVHSQ